ncbi:MAG TPA: hypothetical protein VIO81_12235 [Methyloversatilis sp.]
MTKTPDRQPAATRAFTAVFQVGTGAVPALAMLATLLSSGCSARQAYETGQAWQRNHCDRIVDFEERRRCLEAADVPYDSYRRQTEEDSKPK